jgi:alkyl sulfatase BDS1-like metallo-beta-lactamase superfamily hydrolase
MAQGTDDLDVLELADRLWRGEVHIGEVHPVRPFAGRLVEPAAGVGFVASFGNVSAFSTDDGLVLVDTGARFMAATIHTEVRAWRPDPVRTAVFSHGHVDHVFGIEVFDAEADANGWPRPQVVAHEALPARFDRYVLTAGYNGLVNQRQFQLPVAWWPTEYRYPDETYRDARVLEVGGERFELHHARGETDDHTWTWVPGRRVLCSGDLFIWATPNCGNPQKVQRYPREWAAALREMAALGAEVLLPGHGFPVLGAERVRQALTETAEWLESIVAQTLEMMNAGARLDEIVHTVRPPAHLADRPWLQPVYDEPEFVVRNIWRLYGGWYDGNPANLKPAPERALAAELAALAGGATALARRAAELAAVGTEEALRLAGHLAELATLAEPDDRSAHAVRAEVFERLVALATSTMAKGIYAAAARESRAVAGPGGPSGPGGAGGPSGPSGEG